MTRIAIIGAGIAGASLAQALAKGRQPIEVSVFEKSRGVGGRMATRRRDGEAFDHGTRFFTARSQAFRSFLQPFISQGVVAEWQPRVTTLSRTTKPYNRPWFEPHYCALPGMNGLCKVLLAPFNVHFQTRIDRVSGAPGAWQLHSGTQTFGPFDAVVGSAPGPQTVELLGGWLPDLAQVSFDPCFALMGIAETNRAYDAAVGKDDMIEWISFEASKPGRNPGGALVAQATADWSSECFDKDPGEVMELLQTRLGELASVHLVPGSTQLQRWRYAFTNTAAGEESFFDEAVGIGACGDWCRGKTVEDAFLSGRHLATRVISSLST